jgi:hypothetical protein
LFGTRPDRTSPVPIPPTDTKAFLTPLVRLNGTSLLQPTTEHRCVRTFEYSMWAVSSQRYNIILEQWPSRGPADAKTLLSLQAYDVAGNSISAVAVRKGSQPLTGGAQAQFIREPSAISWDIRHSDTRTVVLSAHLNYAPRRRPPSFHLLLSALSCFIGGPLCQWSRLWHARLPVTRSP